MQFNQILVLLILFLASLALVLKMIIKNQLREVYAVIWIIVTFSILGLIFLYPLIEILSTWLGLASPLSLCFFIGFIVLFGLSLHFSALNSGMQKSLKNAIQKIAILEQEINNFKKNNKI